MKYENSSSSDGLAVRWRFLVLTLIILGLTGLAAAWSWSPLRHWLEISRVVAALEQWGRAFGPVIAILGFSAALSLAVPLTFLTLVTLVAFGPVAGFFITITGAAIGAILTFLLGKALGHEVVRKLAGARVNLISERLARNGVMAVIAVRMVPIAPFAIVNMVAGATHLSLSQMLIGTIVGMMPGTVVMMLFIDQIIEAIKQPSPTTALLLAFMVLLIVGGMWGLRKWLGRIA